MGTPVKGGQGGMMGMPGKGGQGGMAPQLQQQSVEDYASFDYAAIEELDPSIGGLHSTPLHAWPAAADSPLYCWLCYVLFDVSGWLPAYV